MKKTVTVAATAVTLFCAGTALAADSTYLSAKGGIFLPNGRDGADYKGFKFFDTGYSVDLAAGYRPEPYVALEVGSGFYSASGKETKASRTVDRTAYGVPITLTAKGILEVEKLVLSGGGGIGYYFGFLDSTLTDLAAPTNNVSESNHGGALGYQVVADVDFRISDRWTAGAGFKWFSARPEIEMTDTTTLVRTKQKWEFGGMVMSLGAKYSF